MGCISAVGGCSGGRLVTKQLCTSIVSLIFDSSMSINWQLYLTWKLAELIYSISWSGLDPYVPIYCTYNTYGFITVYQSLQMYFKNIAILRYPCALEHSEQLLILYAMLIQSYWYFHASVGKSDFFAQGSCRFLPQQCHMRVIGTVDSTLSGGVTKSVNVLTMWNTDSRATC